MSRPGPSRPAPLRRWAVVTAAAAVVVAVGFALEEVFTPFLLGLLFAYILNPLVELLERRGVSRDVAVPGLFALVLLLIVGVTGFAAFKAAGRLAALKARVQGEPVLDPLDPDDAALLEAARALKEGARPELPPERRALARQVVIADGEAFLDRDGDGARKRGLAEQLMASLAVHLEALQLEQEDLERAARAFEGQASSLSDWGVRLSHGLRRSLSELGQFVSYVLLVPLYTFFLLQSFPHLRDAVRDHLPATTRPQIVTIAQEIDRQVAAFFRGKLLLALLKGVATWVGLWLAGVPFAFFIGMGAGLLSVVPLLGPLVGGALAVVLSYEGPDGFALRLLWVALAFGAAEVVEAVAQPLILGREVGLSPLALILSFFVFGELFGLFGLLLAVPIASAVKTLFNHLVLPELRALAGADPPGGAGSPGPPPAIPSFGRAR